VLVVVEGGLHGPREIEAFTGLPVAGTVPFDPAAASVASGCQGSARRLSRSALGAKPRRITEQWLRPVGTCSDRCGRPGPLPSDPRHAGGPDEGGSRGCSPR
jgi:hypothetical protein